MIGWQNGDGWIANSLLGDRNFEDKMTRVRRKTLVKTGGDVEGVGGCFHAIHAMTIGICSRFGLGNA
jgi:hypothetical protein